MEFFSATLLGLIQGLTEFLPISSSGHLILFRDLFGLKTENDLAFDAILQLATTFAILFYFRKDIFGIFLFFLKKQNGSEVEKEKFKKDKFFLINIIIATLPAIFFGLILEKKMETIFRSSYLVAITLILGSLIMFFADKLSKQNGEIGILKSLGIGFFQALALIPGMSRSGMTISGGLFLGLKREESVRFSFIIAIPILLGTGLKKFLDLIQSEQLFSGDMGISIIVGSIVAFSSGLFAIHFLINFLKKNDFKKFIIYRILLAIIILLTII